jgi:hypothetical protein
MRDVLTEMYCLVIGTFPYVFVGSEVIVTRSLCVFNKGTKPALRSNRSTLVV